MLVFFGDLSQSKFQICAQKNNIKNKVQDIDKPGCQLYMCFSKRVGLKLEVTVRDDHGMAKDPMESASRIFFQTTWRTFLQLCSVECPPHVDSNCLSHFGACYAYSYQIFGPKWHVFVSLRFINP
jgi:hypothetical protein